MPKKKLTFEEFLNRVGDEWKTPTPVASMQRVMLNIISTSGKLSELAEKSLSSKKSIGLTKVKEELYEGYYYGTVFISLTFSSANVPKEEYEKTIAGFQHILNNPLDDPQKTPIRFHMFALADIIGRLSNALMNNADPNLVIDILANYFHLLGLISKTINTNPNSVINGKRSVRYS